MTNKPIDKEGACSICGAPYQNYGNSPEPFKHYHERCCDKCNWEVVVPLRMAKKPGHLGEWAAQREAEQNFLKQMWRREHESNPN